MTRRMVVAGALLIGATALGSTPGQADEQLTAGAETKSTLEIKVPLPVSRPAWIERTASAPRDGHATPQLIAESSASDGGAGLKSGSSEALAVQLEGAKVLSSEGTVVGEVQKLVEERDAGRQAVVSVGGFLGIGESYVLVPAETLSPSGKGMVRTQLTEQQIKNLPAYEM